MCGPFTGPNFFCVICTKHLFTYCAIASQCGYVVCTSASHQGVLGSNPIAARKYCEVYPGLGILQPQWNPYPTLPRLPAECVTSVQLVALRMVRQYAVRYQHATKVPWLLAQKGFDDQ